METQGSVQVVVRLRPLNRREKRDGTLPVVTTNTERGQVTLIKGSGIKAAKHRFTFGNVYGSFCTQEEIFDSTLKPIITDVCSGIESTVFAYGQTGTGKTFTMEGVIDDTELRGLIPRASSRIFDFLSDERFIEKSVSVSYLEIYNEELSDLLTPADEAAKKLSIVASGSGKEQKVYCRNLSKHKVSSVDEILKALRNAQEKRKTAETKMNKASSRSHCLFTLSVHSVEKVDEGTIERNGKLHLVDLAGSECAKNIDQSRMRESSNINQSLLTLGRVITALKEKQPRVPYRDCKLTRILQEALGGRSKTCIIATLSPSILCAEETHSTLNFAERAHGLVNKTIKSDVKMTMQTPNTPKKDVSRTGNAAETSESFRDMEIRLKYMEAQCEEAQTALARKHLIAKNATDRAEKLEKEIGSIQKKLVSAQATLEIARTREEQMKANLDKKIVELKEMGKNLVKSQSSERRLYAEATSLQENLRSSMTYSRELHSQLSNQLSQETDQKKVTLELMAKLKATSEDSSDCSRKHQHFLQSSAREVLQLLEDNVVHTEQQAARLEAEIGSQCNDLEETNQRMSSTLNRALAEVDTLDLELREMQSKREEQLTNGCSHMRQNFDMKMKELVSCVEEYESRLTKWSSARKTSLQEKAEGFNNTANVHKQALAQAAASGKDGILSFIGDLKKHIQSVEDLSQNANHQLYLTSRHEVTLAEFGETLLKRLETHTSTMVEHIENVEATLLSTRSLNDMELKSHTRNMLKQAEEFIAQEKKEFLDRLDELKQISASIESGNLGEFLTESVKQFDEERNSNHRARVDALAKLSEDLVSTKENLRANCLEASQVERLTEFAESHRGQGVEQAALVSKHGAHIQTLLDQHKQTETQEKEHLSSIEKTVGVVSSEVEAGVQMVEEQKKAMDDALAKHKELQASMFAAVMSSLESSLTEQMSQLRERIVEDMSALSTKAENIAKHKRSFEDQLVSNLGTLATETKDWGVLNSKTSEQLEAAILINGNVETAVKAGNERTQLGISEVQKIAELWGGNNRKTMDLIAESNEFVGSTKDGEEKAFQAETETSATLKESISNWQANNTDAVRSLGEASEALIGLQTGIVQSHNDLRKAGDIGLKQIEKLSEKKAGLVSACSNLLSNAKSHHEGLGMTSKEAETAQTKAIVQINQMTTDVQSMQTAITELQDKCCSTMNTSEIFKQSHEKEVAHCSKSFSALTQAQSTSINEEISMVDEMINPQADYLEQVATHSRTISKSIEVYQSDMKQESVSSTTSQAHVQNQVKSKLIQLETASKKSNKELADNSSSIGSLTQDYKKSFDTLQKKFSESHEKMLNDFASESKDACMKQAAVVQSCSEMTAKHCEETLLVNKETMQLSAHRSFDILGKISSPTKAVLPRTELDEDINSENASPNVEMSSKKSRKSFAGTPNKKIGTAKRRNSDTKPSKLREAHKPSFLRKPSKLKAPSSKA